MLEGCAVNLYESMLSEIPEIYLIASGGVASWNDIESLQSIGVPAVTLGKSIYEGKILLSEISRFVAKNQSYVG